MTADDTRQYTEGTLVLDFLDASTQALVWRGIATDAVESLEKSADRINTAVAETLKKYPPTA